MSKKRLLVVFLIVFAICCLTATCFSAFMQTVTKVVAVVNPKVYNGPSPANLTFTGTIFVSHFPVKVRYQWERSDGATGQAQEVEINASGMGVDDTWQLGAPGKRYRVWEKLHILGPTNITSAPAWASVTCQ